MRITIIKEIKDEYLTEPRVDIVVSMLETVAQQVKDEFYSRALTEMELKRKEKK